MSSIVVSYGYKLNITNKKGRETMANAEVKKPKTRMRVRIFDIVRGAALISMVIWHGVYDLINFYGMKIPWFHELPAYLWGQITFYCFILISGACLNLGRKTGLRGLVVLGCGLVITLVTYFAMPQMFISFGILHMFGCSMLLIALLMPVLKKIPWGVGLPVSIALFLLLYLVPQGSIGIFEYPLVDLPSELYRTSFLFPLGFPNPMYYAGDYRPLIPWIFLILTGYFAFRPLKGHPPFTATKAGRNPVEFIGRHTLVGYMLHQPLILFVLMLLNFTGLLH